MTDPNPLGVPRTSSELVVSEDFNLICAGPEEIIGFQICGDTCTLQSVIPVAWTRFKHRFRCFEL